MMPFKDKQKQIKNGNSFKDQAPNSTCTLCAPQGFLQTIIPKPHLFIYSSIYLSIYLSIHPSVCLSVCLSIYLSFYVSIFSIYLFAHLFSTYLLIYAYFLPTPQPLLSLSSEGNGPCTWVIVRGSGLGLGLGLGLSSLWRHGFECKKKRWRGILSKCVPKCSTYVFRLMRFVLQILFEIVFL